MIIQKFSFIEIISENRHWFIFGFILTILMCVLTYKLNPKTFNLQNKFLVIKNFCYLYCIVLIMCFILGFRFANDVSLTKVQDKIHVTGDKVVIDKLDNSYCYGYGVARVKFFGLFDANCDDERRFKLEYNDIYEEGRLISKENDVYTLSKDEYTMLKEKQDRGY